MTKLADVPHGAADDSVDHELSPDRHVFDPGRYRDQGPHPRDEMPYKIAFPPCRSNIPPALSKSDTRNNLNCSMRHTSRRRFSSPIQNPKLKDQRDGHRRQRRPPHHRDEREAPLLVWCLRALRGVARQRSRFGQRQEENIVDYTPHPDATSMVSGMSCRTSQYSVV